MAKTNTLNSHHPERTCSRIDKMSGSGIEILRLCRGESRRFYKKFMNKKRRALLNNPFHWDKI